MASARRTGSNEQVTTYGNCTRTFVLLLTWEEATDTNHVADMETDVLECFDDSASFNDRVTLAGATNDATFFRIIRPASGEGHDGTPNNGVHFDSTNNSALVEFDGESDSHVQDLIIELSINSASTRQGVFLNSLSRAKAVGCLAVDGANSGSGVCQGFRVGNSADVVFVLCLAHNNDDSGFFMDPSATVYGYNNMSTNNGAHGVFNAGGTVVLKNCLSDANTNDDFEAGTYTGSINNAASDTSDPDSGAGNRQNQTFTFVDSGGNDFHLAAGDAGARNFGTDLSADSVYDFDDDIDGDLFNVWDIGFDENDPAVVAEAADIPWFMPVGDISE